MGAEAWPSHGRGAGPGVEEPRPHHGRGACGPVSYMRRPCVFLGSFQGMSVIQVHEVFIVERKLGS